MTYPVAHSSSSISRLMTGALAVHPGWQEPVYIPSPAPGANWSYKVDGRYYLRLVSVRFAFSTSAVVAGRFPQLQLTDSNGVNVTAVVAGNNVVASSSVNPYLTVGGPTQATGAAGATFGFIPDLVIPPDWTWGMTTFGIDVGDQYSAIVLVVQKFPNDTVALPSGLG
jgi:hypothetical protein